MSDPFRAHRQLERFLGYGESHHSDFEPRREYSDAELLTGAEIIATIVYDITNYEKIEIANENEGKKV